LEVGRFPCATLSLVKVQTPSPFYTWLSRRLVTKGLTWATLSRMADVGEPTFTKWKTGRAKPSLEMVRKVAKALDEDPIRLMVIAGLLLPEEVERPAVLPPDVSLFTDEELAAELLLRARRRARAGRGQQPPDLKTDDRGIESASSADDPTSKAG